VRYRFLESVWRFALERLDAHLERDLIRERHLSCQLALASASERGLASHDLAQTLRTLAAEEENLLAALAWCPEAVEGIERGYRLATSVHRLWTVRGRFLVGRRVFEDLLARDTERRPTEGRALALARAAGIALTLQDTAAAVRHLEESLAICRQLGDRRGIARALGGLGVVAIYEERFEDALAVGTESLKLYRELEQPRGVAMALHNLATIEAALAQPDLGRANFEQALELIRPIGDEATEALILSGLSSALVRLGELELAQGRLHEMFALLSRLEAVRESVYALEAAADYLTAIGRGREAAAAFGASLGARAQLQLGATPIEARDQERIRGALHSTASAEEVEGWVREAMTRPLTEAVQEAASATA
jgi:hypothetical protein